MIYSHRQIEVKQFQASLPCRCWQTGKNKLNLLLSNEATRHYNYIAEVEENHNKYFKNS